MDKSLVSHSLLLGYTRICKTSSKLTKIDNRGQPHLQKKSQK